MFCNCIRKTSGKKKQNLTFPQSEHVHQQIKQIARKLDDSEILTKLEKQAVAYHQSCYAFYLTKERRSTQEPTDSSNQKYRNIHKLAFESLKTFISEEVIENNKVMYFAQLFRRYQALLLEYGDCEIDFDSIKDYRVETLQKKIEKIFGDRVTIEASSGPRHQKIIYKTDIDISIMANNTKFLESKEDHKFEDVAYDLRSCIKGIDSHPLPRRLTTDDIIRGECEIPEQLFNFVQNLVHGPNVREKNDHSTTTKITSICSDIIYAVTKGRSKPAKNLTLGLAMKSLTNSRQVITMLNRYGHSIGYNLAEELETEMTYTSIQSNVVIPTGIIATNGLSTHVAFDNFDRFVDTTSGKDTMHDTVGIIYQFTSAENLYNLDATTSSEPDISANEQGPSRKRRRFNEITREIRPYYSKPKTNLQLLPVDSFTNVIDVCQGAAEVATDKDLLWIMALSKLDSVPMWLGYNCLISTDHSEKQKIEYLPPINSSPTSYAIVNETLIMATEIAEKCQQEQIIVTYDLAIAKMAMLIQEKEKPQFDKVFVNLGAFHMEMAFFRAVGKYINCSGLVEILVQAEVLANGSMNSFLDSKHFNRCKRLHPLIAAALQVLHFEQYLSTTNMTPEMLEELLQTQMQNITNENSRDINEVIELPDSLSRILNGYKEFSRQTLMGEKGKTAQFYYQYCGLINLFFRFSRSIRSSNLELYMDSIYNMTDLFFSLNQPNYARWALLYLSNLIDLYNNNSSLVDEFRRGAFGIKRTSAKFARSPVDLTLEQTINADASNQLTDNLAVDSISARQRWALSHSMRTKILTTIKENIGLTKKDDTSHSLQKSKIKKDKESLDSIIKAIREAMNPFDDAIDKKLLFNISTGKATSPEVTDFLLNVKTAGNQQKLDFISDCSSTPDRFEKPIKRNKIINFASQCSTKVLMTKDKNKKVLLKMERDIFGRLLAVSMKKKINVEHCFTFPLAPMPPALFSYTGEMLKTPKSTLANSLKSQVEMVEPTNINVEIIDGFYYLYSIGNSLPQTFEKVAESILMKICASHATEIHLIFDRYLSSSIKDSERQTRKEFDIPYKITGPQQIRPKDFLQSLKNYRFKDALVHFLSDYWENKNLLPIIQNKKIFLTVEHLCYSYQAQDNCIKKIEEVDYTCYHEEADTRIVFHAHKVTPGSRILIKASDTDVLVILLGNMHKLSESTIFLATSATKKQSNHLDCINCIDLALKLGPKLCKSLPAFHAFTGCDYTAAFYNKGKIRPFKIFTKNEKYQTIFASLTDEADIFINEKMIAVQEFTAKMYGVNHCQSVNDARIRIFMKKYGAKEDSERFLKKIRSFDSNFIPPCWISLLQKILRTIYVNSMWLNATYSVCAKSHPENYGWHLDEFLKPTGFVGDQTPLKIQDIVEMEDNEEESNESEEIESNNDTSDESDIE